MAEPELNEDEVLVPLTRSLRIIQRTKGHRVASDDVVLAGFALAAAPSPHRILDLGSGKGAVALMLLGATDATHCTGVEAFEQSHAQATRNAALNGMQGRYVPILADLRNFRAEGDGYDLACGAPPFIRPGAGIQPKDPQRAAGRFELRGGVEAYCQAMAFHLKPTGIGVILMDGQNRQRVLDAYEAAGLSVHRITAINPRPGRAPTYWVVQGGHDLATPIEDAFAMREAEGEHWSPEYRKLRNALSLPETG
jgi:tRNA1(Val) A37 N6-methylase TrmN6